MNKQFFKKCKRFFPLFLFVAMTLIGNKIVPVHAVAQEPANPFGDFDFNSFLKELDEELARLEKEEKAGGGQPVGGQSSGDYDPLFKAPTGKKSPSLGSEKAELIEPTVIPTDQEELFRTPPVRSASGKTKTTAVPVEQAYQAGENWIKRLVSALNELDLLLDSMALSPELKDHVSAVYEEAIISLIVSCEVFTSNKLYMTVLLAPGMPQKEMQGEIAKTREMIIATTKNLEALLQNIRTLVQQEEDLDESARELLKEAQTNKKGGLTTMPSILESRKKPVAGDVVDKEPAAAAQPIIMDGTAPGFAPSTTPPPIGLPSVIDPLAPFKPIQETAPSAAPARDLDLEGDVK